MAFSSLRLSFFFFLLLSLQGVNTDNISKVEEAAYFHIYYGQSFKVIKNSVDGKSYLLIQNNSRMATRTKYCTGRIKSFVVPISNFSIDTANLPVSFFELLGLLGSMKAITSDSVASECVLRSVANGEIALVDKSDTKQLTQFQEHFISNSDQEIACNFATFVPLEEDSPLKRVEWIKYLGAFFNLEARANRIFDAVKDNYNCLNRIATNSSRATFKPVVAWLQFSEGIWSFTKDGHKLQYVLDAGGENIDASINKFTYNISNPDDLDNFHAILCTVEVAIDETYVAQPEDYNLATFLTNINIEDRDCFSFLANKSLWRYDKRTKNSATLDWFDGGISQPQLVLADLIEAFFPTGNFTTTYLRNLAKGEGVVSISPEMCQRDSSTPMEPILVPCN